MEGKPSGPSCSGLNLVAHPRAKSKVWKYFGFDTDADGCILHWKRIYCRVCMTQIAYSGNTSNLAYHLEKNHPIEFSELVKSNTDQMREAFVTAYSKIKTEPTPVQVQPPYDTNLRQNVTFENRRHNDLTMAVLNFISEGLYPVSIVEEPTFKALMTTLDPGYPLPNKADLAVKMVPQMYCRTRNGVFNDLANVIYCGVTTDLWQSLTQNRTYISLSTHSVNYNNSNGGFSMINKCLKTFEVQEDNTAENITREMYEAFVEWGITHKVSGATTNGSVDIVKACSLLEMSVEMPCLGHTINRAMDEAFQLPRVDSFLGCSRKLVDHFKEPAMYLLREKQKQHGLALTPLVSDKGRSWLATLAMLQKLKEQQVAINAVILDNTSGHPFNFDRNNWALLERLIDVLQPFQVVANMFTSCRFPTISMVKPVLHMLLNTTLKFKEGDLKEINMIKEVVSKVLSDTYSQNSQPSQEIAMFLNIATFLDPRYKKLPFLSPQERAKVETNLIDEAKAILEKQTACLEDFSFVSEEPPNKKQASSTHENPLAAIFCQSDTDQGQEELHSQVLEELSNYKSQRVLGLNEDPLLWWSSHAALFPTLPKLLQKYWCVPATSVPCHRLFSSSGTILCGKRNRIIPALVDQQVFLYENSRSYFEPEPCEEDSDSIWEANCNLGQPIE